MVLGELQRQRRMVPAHLCDQGHATHSRSSAAAAASRGSQYAAENGHGKFCQFCTATTPKDADVSATTAAAENTSAAAAAVPREPYQYHKWRHVLWHITADADIVWTTAAAASCPNWVRCRGCIGWVSDGCRRSLCGLGCCVTEHALGGSGWCQYCWFFLGLFASAYNHTGCYELCHLTAIFCLDTSAESRCVGIECQFECRFQPFQNWIKLQELQFCQCRCRCRCQWNSIPDRDE